jgi:hypothetical protein
MTGRAHVSGLPVEKLRSLQGLPATRRTRHRIGERLAVRARSVLGGLHHEYLPAPTIA